MKILVAGIGNIFLGDDGWGCAVAGALRVAVASVPEQPGIEVDVIDFGIRGMDLAFALTSGIDAAILIDAVARGGDPGTLYLIEPHVTGEQRIDNHAMTPGAVLRLAGSLGALPPIVRIVGCEPSRLADDDEIAAELSPAVTASIEPAVQRVLDLVNELATTRPIAGPTQEARCTS